MITNKTKKKLDFSVTVIIVIGIIIAVNFFSYQIFYRLDLTKNKDFSISDISKKTAGELDDIVTINAYFSNNLPSQYINLRQEVGDILDEYRNYSKGNIRIEFIDPGTDEKSMQELYMKGIPALQFNVLEKDKYQVVKGYLGMTISYGDKVETIPVIQDTKSLEYQVSTAIKKVTSKEIAKIGYLTSNGTSATTQGGISTAYQKLGELYEVQTIDLSKDKEISKDITTLIINGPKEKFGADQLKAINGFIMNGGNLIVLVDGVTVGEGLTAKVNETNIDTLLSKYGIKANKDLVEDVSSGMASFNQGFITFSTNYPYWPKIEKDNFDKDNAAVSALETAVLPWASSIEVIKDVMEKDNKISFLAKTTSRAWNVTGDFDITPQGQSTPSQTKKQFNLAIMATGKFKSAYPDDKKAPGETADSRIIVMGDSDFVSDNFIQNTQDNLILFQNMVDSLSLDSDLISIRSKGITQHPISQNLEEWQKAAIRYGNIFGVNLLVTLVGVLRYAMRKRKRFVDGL
jgi:gliding-associated putative ABC transporter substrate-binding component GldG